MHQIVVFRLELANYRLEVELQLHEKLELIV